MGYDRRVSQDSERWELDERRRHGESQTRLGQTLGQIEAYRGGTENLLFEGAVQLPAILNLHGSQLEENLRVIFGLRVRF